METLSLPLSLSLTLFTVRLAVLHVEGVASDWLLAGHAGEAGHVPRVLQGISDLLRSTGQKGEGEREGEEERP